MNINGREILRVFPRKTKATPDDPMAVIGAPTRAILNAGCFDEVHISVTFTYDIPKAEMLAKMMRIAKVRCNVFYNIERPKNGDKM